MKLSAYYIMTVIDRFTEKIANTECIFSRNIICQTFADRYSGCIDSVTLQLIDLLALLICFCCLYSLCLAREIKLNIIMALL